MLPRLWLLVGSDQGTDRPRDRQCQLLSCPGQLKTDIYTFVYSKRQTPLSGGKMIVYYSARPSGLKISICTASVPIITRNYSTSEFSAFCISGLTRTFSEEKSENCYIWSFKFIFEFFNHQSEQIFNILYCQGLHITPSPVGPGDFFLPPG